MSTSIIKILDENTANKIAAGEVVERPASVVKELVENALDAYSRNIEVQIEDGGISYIRVSDDGVGMSAQDAAIAVMRHATSKISSADDLYSIHSLGFRGEALPSIASVSRFSLITRLHSEAMATCVEVEGGVMKDVREAGAGVGTSVIVQELFYNTPARLKFLKTPATENGYIHDIIGKLALSHPEIAFKLINKGRLVLATPGNDDLLECMASLYGNKIINEVCEINFSGENVSITGFVAKPTLIKSSRQWQTFIVNARVVNSRIIAKALDNAYHSLLPKTGYPLAVLKIALPADAIDVNVHPQKSEIKFKEESNLFRTVYNAVSTALAAPKATEAAMPAPVVSGSRPAAAPSVYQEKPYTASHTLNLWREEPIPLSTAREIIKQEEVLAKAVKPEFTENVEAKDDILMPLGQIDDCYIIAAGPDGLYIIDQHAAHERILYDRLTAANGKIPAQQLLVPLVFDFDARESELINGYLDFFHELGFNLEVIGPNTLRLTELPADVAVGEARGFIGDIMTFLQQNQKPSPAELRHACMQTAACRGAVKAGEHLNMRQLQALLSELSATARPYTCPHGRPTTVKFTHGELAKMFKRT